MSAGLQIDRISLRVPGVERELGVRLARLVAERLAPALALAPGEGSIERLQIELTARPGESADSLAGRIVAQVAVLIGEALEAGR